MSLKARAALGYVAALVVPIVLGVLWGGLSPVVQLVPALLFLLFVSLSARFCGFGPALLYIAVSALVLAFHVFDYVTSETSGLVLRVVLYLIISIIIASISRRRSEEAREAEERYRSLVELSPDGVGVADETLTILFANTALVRLLGATDPAQIIGKKLSQFEDPASSSALEDGRRRLSWGGHVPLLETKWRKLDGTMIEVETLGVPVRKHGRLFYQGFVRDITGRKEAERVVQQLSGRLLRAQDEERRRIARQLHDTTAQNLAMIRFNLTIVSRSAAASDAAVAETIRESIGLTEESLSEVRTLSYLLHPPLIDEAGLVAALRWMASGFEARSGIKVQLDVSDDLGELPAETETALFRIIQEALTNIQRHANSRVARIGIDRDDRRIHLEIADEGVGIPGHLRNEKAVFASGVGIAGIRQRARDLGGEMHIESTSSGTKVTVVLPAGKA